MTSNDDDLLLQLLCCPRCGGELVFGDELICSDCRAQYPRVGGLPCLFPEPEAALGEWRTRLSSVVAELESQASRYRAAITDDVTRATTRSRLKLLGGAYADHARRLKALLSPLGVSEAGAAVETYRALSGAELPGSQGLIGYYANLHRDWCWGEAENEAAFDIVDAALGSNEPGRMLVLGAGAGRLAYKLRRRRNPEILVAADINPLMLLVAAKMIAGESLELYEFPVAPRDLDSHAILRTLQAPEPVENGLQLILADVSRGPFAPGGFDTIVTPWLVDILAEDFSTFARRINTWLKPDGRWVNSGSLVFQHADAKRCYSTEEVRELIGEAGFKSASAVSCEPTRADRIRRDLVGAKRAGGRDARYWHGYSEMDRKPGPAGAIAAGVFLEGARDARLRLCRLVDRRSAQPAGHRQGAGGGTPDDTGRGGPRRQRLPASLARRVTFAGIMLMFRVAACSCVR
jgi:uncharacterized protein YbaR (Trm112 family)/SAM-dependent methyltransferase